MAKRKSGMKKKTKIERYAKLDLYGESHLHSELLQVRAYLAKAVNRRLLQFERANLHEQSQAYMLAKDYLSRKGKRRFSESRNFRESDDKLKREILELQSFINKPTSTVAKYKRVIESIGEFIDTQKFIEHSKGEPSKRRYTESEKELAKFLGREEVRDFKTVYASDSALDYIIRAHNEGISYDRLSAMMSKHQCGEISSITEIEEELGIEWL